MISRLKLFFVFFLAGMVASTNLHADRLKDLTSIAGVRSNQLVGYGLVVGLAGTGDGNATLTQQALQSSRVLKLITEHFIGKKTTIEI